jgi:hypothetical protein
MNDDDLSNLLKKLPQHQASPEFTDRVIARLDAPARTAGSVNRRWVFAAAVAAIVGLWLGASALDQRAERREAAERLEAMRAEYRALELELEELRALATDAQPVLELGSTEQVDFVFDLRELASERERARATPVSHSRP